MRTGNAVLDLLAARFTAWLATIGQTLLQGPLMAGPKQQQAAVVAEKVKEDEALVGWAEATRFDVCHRTPPQK